MSDSANHPENGNGAADAGGPKLGRVAALPPRGEAPSGGRMTRHLRLWARQNFSRKQLLTSFRTMLWVVPLTVLIWIYAEREQQFTPPPVTIPIEITTNDPNRLVTLRRPDQPLVMATITGPRSGVEAVIHSWDPKYGAGPVTVPIDRNLGTGDRRIDASVIGNDPRFASHGVSITSCQPAWLDVLIDPIVDMQVDVKAVNVPLNVGAVTFSPPTVKIRGPQKSLDEAAAAGKLHAEANLAHQAAFAALNPSDSTANLKDVGLTLPIDDHNVTIVGTPVVQADVVLKTGKEVTLATVNVEVTTSADVMDHDRIEYEPTLRDVTVIGPEDKIELLSPSNPDWAKYCRATFEVTSADISSQATTAAGKTVPVEFKFPPGVQYKSGPSTINFHLTALRSGE
jgi:hypothetical protein